MPLVKNVLESAIARIIDKWHPQFEGFPATPAQLAHRWMSAIHVEYAGANLLPPVLPAPADNAGFILWSALMDIEPVRVDQQKLEKAIALYATALATAVAPPYQGIPPSAVLDFSPAYQLGQWGSGGVPGVLAELMDGYFKTGTAVNTTNGTTIPWS